jgi:hypothetical protein
VSGCARKGRWDPATGGSASQSRHQAIIQDVDYRAPRGLDRALFHKLAGGEWIDAHDNLILCDPTGVGKSWLQVLSATRPAAITVPCFISASQSSSPNSRWRAATGLISPRCTVKSG